MIRSVFRLRLYFWGILIPVSFSQLQAQETNGRAYGKVASASNDDLANITVTAVHEPTQSRYSTITRSDGNFDFVNIKPGGPYTLAFTSPMYETFRQNNLFIYLQGESFYNAEGDITEFRLQKKIVSLGEIVITARTSRTNAGIETTIATELLNAMPNINRSFHDLVRLVPQARVSGEGSISLAGQNNRFNAFFIDGGNGTDIRGLSANGMNGGQTGSPPISIEAIEEIKVLQAPYHVQYGNFTGGSINAITKSGTNENKSSAWYYFRNEHFAGRSPQAIESPDDPGKFYRPKLTKFFNQTYGGWNSGALVRDKLFYFVLVEQQSETRPQIFSIKDYRGQATRQQLQGLTEFLQNKYQYQTGSFLATNDDLQAFRMNVKMDWNASPENKLMFSYRYNNAERRTAPRPSSASALFAYNSGIIIPATTHSASLEWKYFARHNLNNRLLATFTSQNDHRKWMATPFPSVTISDGNNASLNFGSESATGLTHFKGADFGLLDICTFVNKKHYYTAGIDLNYTIFEQRAVPSFFGNYHFRNLNEFMNGGIPSNFQRAFYMPENYTPKFLMGRYSLFLNDEIRLLQNLKITMGIRLDINSTLSKPTVDRFFNDTARPVISKHYDLEGARSGPVIRSQWAFSPRFSAEYKPANTGLTLKTGGGVFVGHIVNTWLFDVFNSNTGNIDIPPLQFVADPYNQPSPQSLNIDPSNLKGNLTLLAKRLKYPSVFRTTFTAEKKIANNWIFSAEWMFTKNIRELVFQNVNIEPPTIKSAPPDSRNIYSLNSAPTKIPLRSNGMNPYAQIMLLTNNHNATGYSYSASFMVQKQVKDFSFNGSYTYGASKLLFEITGPQTPVFSQWRNLETINGRNEVTRSTSDNDLQHRVFVRISKRIHYCKRKMAATFSIVYNGQSGAPYSYVYGNSMINDNGRRANEVFDLIYIPTVKDLASMNFLPITGSPSFSAEQQREALNSFIETDKYLRSHRGEFAKRNAARLPATHVVDLRLQQELQLKMKKKSLHILLTYDIFNFTNMLNKNWGQIHFLLNDSHPLMRFVSFINSSSLTPQYQFTPTNKRPYTLQTSTVPGNSARWISQLGMKITLD